MAEQPRRGILAGGNWLIDYTKIIDVYPAQDALANILSQTSSNGGAPYNVLIDLARLGARFPLMAAGLVGDDEAGAFIRRHCEENGIDTSNLQTCREAPTSYTDVMTVQGTGRRTFFHQRGANAHLGPEHFDFTRASARIFHLGYLLLLDRLDQPDPEYGTVAASVLKRAKDAGLITSVDLVSEDSDRFSRIVRPALQYCDYLLLNEFEAERTTGIQIVHQGKVELHAARRAARELLAAGVRRMVVIHWPEKAIAVGANGAEWGSSSIQMPQEQIAGTAGAGDAFAAGFLLGIHENQSVGVALQYGVCTAAASLTDATTSGGIRSLSECLEMGDRYGYRKIGFFE